MQTSTWKVGALGVVIGFMVALSPACGPTTGPTVTRCSASNCDGCCDDTGQCYRGISSEACGLAGASCAPCLSGQTCTPNDPSKPLADAIGGKCVSSSTGTGGGAGTGGGTATGGGAGTGGSTATGGGTGTGGGPGACNATTCANGCCTAAGACVTNTTTGRCGKGGAACTACQSGNTCVTGACTPCAGCVDLSTGKCETGTVATNCGKGGGFCQRCDTNAGQACNAGLCSGGSGCNSTNCANGCCDGVTCKPSSGWSKTQCGAGAGGAACMQCLGAQTCDAVDAGTCVGDPNPGTGGGFGTGGGLPSMDGGFPAMDSCSLAASLGLGTACTATECCDVDAIFGFLPTCYPSGATCGDGVKKCNATALVCQ